MRVFLMPRAARLGGLASLGGLLLVAAACKKDSDIAAVAQPAQTITFKQEGLYPEGTQYDAQGGRFLVSSQTTGKIGLVTGDDSTTTYSVFADSPDLVSTIGLNLDAPRNRLLAAVANPGYNKDRANAATVGKLAGLAIFDRSTGTQLQYLDLGGLPQAKDYPSHFANDIAIDAQGNAYVTDSYAPVIYKVDNKYPTATASVWATDTLFKAPAGTFGLNGIVYHPSGYLLVARSARGQLLKVPVVNGAAGPPTVVALPNGLSLSGADGLQLLNNATLLVVCNAQGKVYQLTTNDDYGSVANDASKGSFSTGSVYPTTLARRPATSARAAASYVLYSHLDALRAGKNPPVAKYSLQPLPF